MNYAVQRTLDRILFFRISEDRGIEESKRLNECLEDKEVYSSLCKMFLDADDRYNSGLFHFHKSTDRPTPPDELSLELKIDSKVLKDIISGLYYPQCPYEFSVIPVEILGQVYERFLGKEIVLSKGGKVSITDKPLVKKAGGVFYTPSYIVNKIIEDTIGVALKGKTPKQVENIKIIDPACGSGSFLISVYDYLLKWHLDEYLKSKAKYKNKIFENGKDEWFLTPQEKKRILLNNVFGVDIDAQAVETTKLSLCLKVLEGETSETIAKQLSLFKEQALPDIGDNIKCGNSLVSTDIGITELNDEELYKINPFDWNKEFKDVFSRKNPGFDIVVGNPPYLRVQGLNEFHGNEIAYYSNKYKSAIKRFDMYLLFIEKSYEILNQNGYLGFICPHKFVNSDFGSGIRKFLIENKAISKMISFDYNLIFKKATTYTCLLYLSKKNNKILKFLELPELKEGAIRKFLNNITEKQFSNIALKDLGSDKWVLSSDKSLDLLDRLGNNKGFYTIEEAFSKVGQGIVTGNDDTHLVKIVKRRDKNIYLCSSEAQKEPFEIEAELLKPCLTGKEVKRFEKHSGEIFCIFPYVENKGKSKIIEEAILKKKFPLGYNYLKLFKKELTAKKVKYKTNPKYWYSLHRARDISLYENTRVITPEISYYGNFRVAYPGQYHNAKVYSLVPSKENQIPPHAWMAILNSNFTWWYMCKTGYVLRGGYSSFASKYLNSLPIPRATKDNKDTFDKLKIIGEKLETVKAALSESRAPSGNGLLNRQFEGLIDEINSLTYSLYEFSFEEIEYIEGSMRKEKTA